jgi:hypothetical protein
MVNDEADAVVPLRTFHQQTDVTSNLAFHSKSAHHGRGEGSISSEGNLARKSFAL